MKIIEKLKKFFVKKPNLVDPIEELYKDYKKLKKQLELVADRRSNAKCEWFRENIQIYLKNWETFRKSFEQYNQFLKTEIDAFKKINENKLEK